MHVVDAVRVREGGTQGVWQGCLEKYGQEVPRIREVGDKERDIVAAPGESPMRHFLRNPFGAVEEKIRVEVEDLRQSVDSRFHMALR